MLTLVILSIYLIKGANAACSTLEHNGEKYNIVEKDPNRSHCLGTKNIEDNKFYY